MTTLTPAAPIPTTTSTAPATDHHAPGGCRQRTTAARDHIAPSSKTDEDLADLFAEHAGAVHAIDQALRSGLTDGQVGYQFFSIDQQRVVDRMADVSRSSLAAHVGICRHLIESSGGAIGRALLTHYLASTDAAERDGMAENDQTLRCVYRAHWNELGGVATHAEAPFQGMTGADVISRQLDRPASPLVAAVEATPATAAL